MIRHAAILLAVASTCSIICGVACDTGEVPACAVPQGIFGPCVDGACSPGLTCTTALSGHICTIPVPYDQEPLFQACAANFGTIDCADDDLVCSVGCTIDADCDGGTVCDEDLEICVHPWSTIHGELGGPCLPSGAACNGDLECASSLSGSICSTASGWGLWACNVNENCLEGQVCAADLGHCVWPYDQPPINMPECAELGGMFGQCVGGGCWGKLECFAGLAGEICVPMLDLEELSPSKMSVLLNCAAEVGVMGVNSPPQAFGAVLVPCVNDGGCIDGAVCEENIGACMHPTIPQHVTPPPGATLGPCDASSCVSIHDECLVASDVAGSICSRMDQPEWVVACSSVSPTCPNGQICSVQDLACVWPD